MRRASIARRGGLRRGAAAAGASCATRASSASASKPKRTIAPPICCSRTEARQPMDPRAAPPARPARPRPQHDELPDPLRLRQRRTRRDQDLHPLPARDPGQSRRPDRGPGGPTSRQDGPIRPRPARPSCALLPDLSVQSRQLSPPDAFVAVEYRGNWYWIDERNYCAKRVFSVLLLLLNLVDKSGSRAAAGDHHPDRMTVAAV